MVAEFVISATSDRFWNKDAFVEFLFRNRGRALRLRMDPEAICLHTLGVYGLLQSSGAQQVEIVTSNPLESHPVFKMCLLENTWFDYTPNIPAELHSWNLKKLFMAIYGRPTAGRLVLGSYLMDWYPERTHIHFSIDTDHDSLLHFELDKSLQYDRFSIARIGAMINRLPVLLASRDRYTSFRGYDYSDPLTKFYQDILIDVVVESHVLGDSFFPTEKTMRPIHLKKPFIVFSNYNYLTYLRRMGFKTFHAYWDENYDGFETTNRITHIYKVIDRLAGMPLSELESMYLDMQPILEHNFHMLQDKTFSRKIDKIV